MFSYTLRRKRRKKKKKEFASVLPKLTVTAKGLLHTCTIFCIVTAGTPNNRTKLADFMSGGGINIVAKFHCNLAGYFGKMLLDKVMDE